MNPKPAGCELTPEYRRAWAKKHRSEIRGYQRKYRAKRNIFAAWRQVITASLHEFCTFLREEHPCTDCGRYDLPYTMEFDHIQGKRECSPSASGGWPRLYRELAKCEIVCARCHRIRTHARKA